MAERHGKNSQVIIDGTIVKCTQMDLNMTQDQVEVTGFGDTNKRYVNGTADFQATFSGFWTDASDKLFDVVDAAAPVNAYFYPDVSNAATQYWWGSVLLQASLGSSVSGAVTFSGSAAAQGTITRAGVA
jgi:hypothetical protein